MSEKVIGYSILGEEKQTNNNFINYSISPEQTKDEFNTINANNQTTTGMATIIPGLNSQKLIDTTSVINNGIYCQYSLAFSGTLYAGNYGDFNDMSVMIESPYIKIDSNDSSKIILSDGIYIMTLKINTHNANVNYKCSAGLWQGGIGEDIVKFSGNAGEVLTHTVVFQTINGYMKVGLNTDYDIDNTSGSYMVIAKIA